MLEQPRLALGTVQPGRSVDQLAHGLVEVLRRYEWSCQVFSAQARLEAQDQGWRSGRGYHRHLDSWLMTPDETRWYFAHGSEGHDLSLICGRFGPIGPDANANAESGGSLDELCNRLRLPRLVVLDVRDWDPCLPPTVPGDTSGILLTGCRDDTHLAQCQTVCETLWSIPVLGGLCESAEGDLHAAHRRGPAWATRDAAVRLGDELRRTVHLSKLLKLAVSAGTLPFDGTGVWPEPQSPRPISIALAFDDAFHCYFPDTLDCLEKSGVRLLDFSPLRGESIPDGVELVWFGCGHPERHAERLSRNVCMHQSIRDHVRAGRRVYAEGGGVAFVCQSMEYQRRRYSMAGLLPARATFEPHTTRAVELKLQGEGWPADASWRGYLNDNWSIQAEGPLVDYSACSNCPLSLVGHLQTLGSRVPLHCASHGRLLSRLVWPTSK